MEKEIKQKLNNVWAGINKRCNYKKHPYYYRYGGRGIKNEWKSIKDFRNDMYPIFKAHIEIYGLKNTTIDRINNDSNYFKDNCRCATIQNQARNRNNTKKFNGVLEEDIAKQLGGSRNLIRARLKMGWNKTDSISKELWKADKHKCNGELLTFREICEKYDVKLTTLLNRIYKYGFTLDEASTKKKYKKVAKVTHHFT